MESNSTRDRTPAQEDRDAARAVGIRDVILKPDTVDELGQALAGLFQQMDLGAG